jgi:hypothetical protein
MLQTFKDVYFWDSKQLDWIETLCRNVAKFQSTLRKIQKSNYVNYAEAGAFKNDVTLHMFSNRRLHVVDKSSY